ncbi:MAG: HAD hydrolase-like protein [Holophagae bacterium]|nr:HAD hydrolase-like protein [Holophagae bacterium]
MIGDNPDTDIRGAVDAGLQAAWYNPKGENEELANSADWKGRVHIVHSYRELSGQQVADNFADIAERQRSIPTVRFGPELIDSLKPDQGDFQQVAKEVLDLREKYFQTAIAVKSAHFKRIEGKTITP